MNITILDAQGSIINIIEAESLLRAGEFYPFCRESLSTDTIIQSQSTPINVYSVDKGWLMKVLYEQGYYQNILDFVATLAKGDQILFANVSIIDSRHPLVLAWAATQNPPITLAQIDALFKAAIAMIPDR